MAQRKLQQEIDKVFKKVKEGLDIFDTHYEKLQLCESQPQKEKLESEMKKEIKKLQRQRDQIKNWASGNDVKDKKPLLEYRRLIEDAMERFKEVERSLKTKTFSKEGLDMDRTDPRQAEKDECSEFLQSMLEELERQNEKHEANIALVQGSVKKGRKLDSSKQAEVDDMQEKIERNKVHEEKLEQMLRLVSNDAIDVDQVNMLREDIKYYVDSNEDADFLEDEYIYDDLALDEAEENYNSGGDYNPPKEDEFMIAATSANTPKKASVGSTTQHNGTSNINNNISTATPIKTHAPLVNHTPYPAVIPSTIAPNLKPAIAPKAELKYASVASAALSQSSSNTPKAVPATLSNVPAPQQNGSIQTQLKHVAPSPGLPPPGLSAPTTIQTPTMSYASTASAAPEPHHVNQQPPSHQPQQSQEPVVPQRSVDDSKDMSVELAKILGRNVERKETTGEFIQDLVSSLAQAKDRLVNPLPYSDIQRILDTSLLNCPDSLDADRPRMYQPQNPHNSSIYYPQEPLPELQYTTTVGKLDESTLFFNFYYNQGQFVQLQSARQLVKRGWAYDTLSQKWYSRAEEIIAPQLINGQLKSDEKKTRTVWKYFDNDIAWMSRRKEDFDPESVQFATVF